MKADPTASNASKAKGIACAAPRQPQKAPTLREIRHSAK